MSLPEATTKQDRLLTININEAMELPSDLPGTTVIPLFLDRENGVWVLYAKFEPGCELPTHFHTGTVHFFTTKGQWNYKEHAEDPQTPGSYLYEPGGSVHTFTVPKDATQAAEGFMVVHGANINFLGNDFLNIMDAGAIEQSILDAVKADIIPMPKYIRPNGGAGFSSTEKVLD